MRVLSIAALTLLAGATAYAQDDTARRIAVETAARVPLEKATKGAPYSAETFVENSQTLADGNRINRTTTGRVYRDAEGRTRREEDRPDGSVAISIVDPVGGFSYSLDPKNRIAWRTAMGASGAIMGKLEASAAEQRKVETERAMAEQKVRTGGETLKAAAVEEEQKVRAVAAARGGAVIARSGGPAPNAAPLEHKTLEGLAVEGRKTTAIIPAGQIGNEQPITITSEEWRSPELNILILTRHSDPRMGESTYRLQNVIRAEPDRSFFTVPPDYTVKDTGIRRMLEASRKQ